MSKLWNTGSHGLFSELGLDIAVPIFLIITTALIPTLAPADPGETTYYVYLGYERPGENKMVDAPYLDFQNPLNPGKYSFQIVIRRSASALTWKKLFPQRISTNPPWLSLRGMFYVKTEDDNYTRIFARASLDTYGTDNSAFDKNISINHSLWSNKSINWRQMGRPFARPLLQRERSKLTLGLKDSNPDLILIRMMAGDKVEETFDKTNELPAIRLIRLHRIPAGARLTSDQLKFLWTFWAPSVQSQTDTTFETLVENIFADKSRGFSKAGYLGVASKQHLKFFGAFANHIATFAPPPRSIEETDHTILEDPSKSPEITARSDSKEITGQDEPPKSNNAILAIGIALLTVTLLLLLVILAVPQIRSKLKFPSYLKKTSDDQFETEEDIRPVANAGKESAKDPMTELRTELIYIKTRINQLEQVQANGVSANQLSEIEGKVYNNIFENVANKIDKTLKIIDQLKKDVIQLRLEIKQNNIDGGHTIGDKQANTEDTPSLFIDSSVKTAEQNYKSLTEDQTTDLLKILSEAGAYSAAEWNQLCKSSEWVSEFVTYLLTAYPPLETADIVLIKKIDQWVQKASEKTTSI